MCGIVGYIGHQDATPIILNGLKRLEYRGYNSAGLAVIQNGSLQIRRDVGKLSRLEKLISRITCTWSNRDWTYSMGYPWSTQRSKCPSPCRDDRKRSCCTQWNRREFSRAS